jgi:membrane protein implicated in regulation of membrane protease activity
MVTPPGIAPLQLDLFGPDTLSLLLIISGLGVSLMEALAPGAHLIVLGVALLLAGLVGLLIGSFATPIVLAALVLLFGAVALVGYRELDIYGGKGSGKTRDSTSLRGKIGYVTERVTPTSGEIKLEEGGFNPYYAARSIDSEISEGAEVIVVDPGGGNVVTVAALDEGEDEIDRELARGRSRERETDGRSEDRPSGDRHRETDTERA